MLKGTLRAVILGALLAAFGSGPALAAELRIGLAAPVTSLDPVFYVGGPNSAMSRNMYDALVNQDEKQQIRPALALSWTPVGDTTWEFRLRSGVRFHDGTPLTAEDVAATIRRVPMAAENSPSSFMRFVKDIKKIEVVDPLTVRLHTETPVPLLPNYLSRISIMPAAMEKARTQDLDKGNGVIGTGPYRFVSWQPDSQIVLEANPDYWGGKPAWDKVVYRFIPTDSSRVAALLAGDVDLIENVPSSSLNVLRKNQNFRLESASGNRVLYLALDHDREVSPFAAGPDGKNPLRDRKVRQAMSMAIARDALIARIMDGQGVPAGQLVPQGFFGWVPGLEAPKADMSAAKKLLAEAGYPDGFTLTYHATNDRYPNDEKVAQAIGQMFSKIGIKVSVVTLPGNVYFSRASAREFSIVMGGAAAETGEAASVLGPLLATFDKEKGQGQGNRGRYSNPEFDRLYGEALVNVDDAKREKLLQDATRLAMEDVGVIPVFFFTNNWAMRKDLAIAPRADGYTLAFYVSQK